SSRASTGGSPTLVVSLVASTLFSPGIDHLFDFLLVVGIKLVELSEEGLPGGPFLPFSAADPAGNGRIRGERLRQVRRKGGRAADRRLLYRDAAGNEGFWVRRPMSQEITVSQRSRLPCVEVTSAWCSNDRTQSH